MVGSKPLTKLPGKAPVLAKKALDLNRYIFPYLQLSCINVYNHVSFFFFFKNDAILEKSILLHMK